MKREDILRAIKEQKPIAQFTKIEKGVVTYRTHIKDYSKQIPTGYWVSFEVPFLEITNKLEYIEDANELIKWLI